VRNLCYECFIVIMLNSFCSHMNFGAVQDITTSDLAVRITNFNQRIKFEKSKLESEMRKLKDGNKLCLLG